MCSQICRAGRAECCLQEQTCQLGKWCMRHQESYHLESEQTSQQTPVLCWPPTQTKSVNIYHRGPCTSAALWFTSCLYCVSNRGSGLLWSAAACVTQSATPESRLNDSATKCDPIQPTSIARQAAALLQRHRLCWCCLTNGTLLCHHHT